jgi:predicted membrane protein
MSKKTFTDVGIVFLFVMDLACCLIVIKYVPQALVPMAWLIAAAAGITVLLVNYFRSTVRSSKPEVTTFFQSLMVNVALIVGFVLLALGWTIRLTAPNLAVK